MKENKNKGFIICIIILAAVILVGGFAFSYYLGRDSVKEEVVVNATPTPSIEEQKYQKAIELREQGMYQDAADLFHENSTYKDSMEQYYQTLYELGQKKMSEGDYEEAKTWFNKISGYEDAEKQAMDCDYNIAVAYYRNGKYKKALALFEQVKDNEDARAYVSKCSKKIKQAEDYFRIGYVVNDSEEDSRGEYYINGEGTLRLRSEQGVDDWVGVSDWVAFSGDYVASTIPQSEIKFRLQNKGEKALKNPVIHVYFDEVWLRRIYDPFGSVDSDHVHGVGGSRGAVWEKYGTINAGDTEYLSLPMNEAYFCNGEKATMTIEVSADNYKKRVYKVDVVLSSITSTIVISGIEGNTMYYHDGVFTSEIIKDFGAERIVGYGEEKQIKISKDAKYYLMNSNKQSNYRVSRKKFMAKQKKDFTGEAKEKGVTYYYGMACSMIMDNDICIELREEFQP